METGFNAVLLFGYSPLFSEITDYSITKDIRTICIYSQRQAQQIESLGLSKSVVNREINILSEEEYDKLKIEKSKSLGLSFGAPFIFSSKDIDRFDGNLINSHGAPLPSFKGGGGFSWRILQRDRRGASLMHLINERIDEGPVVYRKNFVFPKKIRTPQDYERYQLKSDKKFLLPWLKSIISGRKKLNAIKKSSILSQKNSTYFPRLQTDLHGYIDWSLRIEDIESFILAFSHPYPGASTYIRGKKVRIYDCKIDRKCRFHPFMHGLIIKVSSTDVTVACNSGSIIIDKLDIKIEGNDYEIQAGDRFITPQSKLLEALSSRIIYTPSGYKIQ